MVLANCDSAGCKGIKCGKGKFSLSPWHHVTEIFCINHVNKMIFSGWRLLPYELVTNKSPFSRQIKLSLDLPMYFSVGTCSRSKHVTFWGFKSIHPLYTAFINSRFNHVFQCSEVGKLLSRTSLSFILVNQLVHVSTFENVLLFIRLPTIMK